MKSSRGKYSFNKIRERERDNSVWERANDSNMADKGASNSRAKELVGGRSL